MPSTDRDRPVIQQRLPPRLMAVADLVPPCRKVWDIGTDHAWLPIALVLGGRCERAAAVDCRNGPLAVAACHIAQAGLSDRIELIHNDGLCGLPLATGDTLVLAGLGGYEIMEILCGSQARCQPVVIQAMKSWPELRLFLAEKDYAVCDETLTIDRGRPYVAALCQPAGSRQPVSLLESWVGPVLLHKRPSGWNLYLDTLLRHLQKKCRGDSDLQSLAKQVEDLKIRHFEEERI